MLSLSHHFSIYHIFALTETLKGDFQNYHYDLKKNDVQCEDALVMTAEECFIAAKKLGFTSTDHVEVDEVDKDNFHSGCWIIGPHEDPNINLNWPQVYFNKNLNGKNDNDDWRPRSICKIKING